MKKYILSFIFLIVFVSVEAQYHLDQLSDSLKVYLKEGWYCWNETEEESCVPYYQQFFEVVKASGECLPCAETELARIYAWEGQYETSIKHSQNVLRDAKKYDGRLRYELENDAYNEMAGNYLELGNLEKALEYFLKALEAIDEIEKFDRKTAREYRAITKYNIGAVYGSMNDCKKAIEYQKETFYELTALGNNRTCQVADGIAGEYFLCKETDSAKIWAFKTIELAKTQNIGNQFEMSAYTRLAEIYKEQYPDSALYYINKALKFETAENLKLQTARIYNSKGNIHSALGNYTEAKKSFTKAKELFPEDAKQDLIVLYNAWGTAAHKHGDYKTASENLMQFIQLNDSINAEKTQKTVRELNTKYESEKKEKQIAEQELKIQKQKSNLLYALLGGGLLISLFGGIFIYNRKAQKLKLQRLQQEKENAILNSFIQGEERERNRISHELHDGVAAMIGAAKMNLETLPHLPTNQQYELIQRISTILENTHADVRHIAHNLLPATLEQEGIIEATKHFVSEINQSKLVHFSITDQNSQATQFPQKTQLMLFRIIQELVNNIIKHSQAQNANIVFTKKDNRLNIEISDDGIGFDNETTKNSQGLYSIKQRLQSINGSFSIRNIGKKGMKAIVELKMM